MGSRRMEDEEKEEQVGWLLHGERCDTPLWFSKNGSRRMENVNYLSAEILPGTCDF